jgi:hypothetical protein
MQQGNSCSQCATRLAELAAFTAARINKKAAPDRASMAQIWGGYLS